jgi:N6-adenosine-specific RNA methylase IME4
MTKYRTIVVDPPWKLNKFNPKLTRKYQKSNPELPYNTMTDREIMDFPIDNFADEQCDLFLWTTKAKLHTAFHVIEAWNFHYANILVWNKISGLCHNGIHATVEFLLYAYRGKNGLDYKKPLCALFTEKNKKHSQKPEKIYGLLREHTNAPRIDIFARKHHIGFDAWGNQVESQIQVPLMIVSPKVREEK